MTLDLSQHPDIMRELTKASEAIQEAFDSCIGRPLTKEILEGVKSSLLHPASKIRDLINGLVSPDEPLLGENIVFLPVTGDDGTNSYLLPFYTKTLNVGQAFGSSSQAVIEAELADVDVLLQLFSAEELLTFPCSMVRLKMKLYLEEHSK